jgi:hypothetical protein
MQKFLYLISVNLLILYSFKNEPNYPFPSFKANRKRVRLALGKIKKQSCISK